MLTDVYWGGFCCSGAVLEAVWKVDHARTMHGTLHCGPGLKGSWQARQSQDGTAHIQKTGLDFWSLPTCSGRKKPKDHKRRGISGVKNLHKISKWYSGDGATPDGRTNACRVLPTVWRLGSQIWHGLCIFCANLVDAMPASAAMPGIMRQDA